ncbi:hypothetical protein OC846_003333 [Tilletia horrida]|uniref:EXPERA domain-containing protein n=1 Tax=Tilletia horrida TaxID=155126 RepID=A0AAN6GSB7_9BASI|nr:hypothetical protein OC846_003333 [Tilletia horrida]
MPASKANGSGSIAARIHPTRTWIVLWLALSSILVMWDCGYMLLRPHSMKGGKWFAPWTPYELYGTIDKIYGLDAFNAREGFPAAQSWMNIPETILNYLYMLVEVCCGYCKTGHNSLSDLIFLFLIPNTPWIFVPTAIALTLGFEMADSLKAASGLPVKSIAKKVKAA